MQYKSILKSISTEIIEIYHVGNKVYPAEPNIQNVKVIAGKGQPSSRCTIRIGIVYPDCP